MERCDVLIWETSYDLLDQQVRIRSDEGGSDEG